MCRWRPVTTAATRRCASAPASRRRPSPCGAGSPAGAWWSWPPPVAAARPRPPIGRLPAEGCNRVPRVHPDRRMHQTGLPRGERLSSARRRSMLSPGGQERLERGSSRRPMWVAQPGRSAGTSPRLAGLRRRVGKCRANTPCRNAFASGVVRGLPRTAEQRPPPHVRSASSAASKDVIECYSTRRSSFSGSCRSHYWGFSGSGAGDTSAWPSHGSSLRPYSTTHGGTRRT